jgi:hypothetical protein
LNRATVSQTKFPRTWFLKFPVTLQKECLAKDAKMAKEKEEMDRFVFHRHKHQTPSISLRFLRALRENQNSWFDAAPSLRCIRPNHQKDL